MNQSLLITPRRRDSNPLAFDKPTLLTLVVASLLLMDRREGVPMEDLRHVLRLLRMQGTALVLSASFLVSTATDSLWLRPRAVGGSAA